MRFSLPLIALAAIAAPVAAVATPADTTVTVKVAFDDLDVTTPEGRAALEARIDAKTRSACTIDAASRYAYGRPVIDEVCMAEARAKALATADRIAAAKSRNGSQVAAN
ncbi:MAG: UrcA family protein [Pseudomonadota bacterium]